jgi:hypothetical protein
MKRKKARRLLLDLALKWEVYLIFGILACVPDRQRTLRELKIGKTLFKEVDGEGFLLLLLLFLLLLHLLLLFSPSLLSFSFYFLPLTSLFSLPFFYSFRASAVGDSTQSRRLQDRKGLRRQTAPRNRIST